MCRASRLLPYLRLHSRQRESASKRDSRRPFVDCTEVRGTMSSFKTTEVQNSLVMPARLGPQKPPGGENAQQLVPACHHSMLTGLMWGLYCHWLIQDHKTDKGEQKVQPLKPIAASSMS